MEAVQESLTSIRVSWSPPTPLEATTGYRIYCYTSGEGRIINVTDGSTNNSLLTGLLNGDSYNISILATSKHISSQPINASVYLGKFKIGQMWRLFYNHAFMLYTIQHLWSLQTHSQQMLIEEMLISHGRLQVDLLHLLRPTHSSAHRLFLFYHNLFPIRESTNWQALYQVHFTTAHCLCITLVWLVLFHTLISQQKMTVSKLIMLIFTSSQNFLS